MNTDDRPPTMYLKIKNHKPTFHHTTTQYRYTCMYTNGANDLLPITRAIINQKTLLQVAAPPSSET